MIYVNGGGARSYAYDALISFAVGRGASALALDLYERAKQAGVFDALLGATLFNIGTIYMSQGRNDEAAELYALTLQRDPGDPATLGNLTQLAREHDAPSAIRHLEPLIKSAYRSTLNAEAEPAHAIPSAEPSYLQDWDSTTPDAVRAAVLRHGFCFLRNACHVAQVRQFHAAVLAHEARSDPFPFAAKTILEPKIEELYRFDARALISGLFQAPAALDLERSVVRRVTPARQESFTPFHQDSTAFAAALINIWTPLTPAGGEHPSFELIAQHMTRAEETLVRRGEYNRVEIAEDYVLSRYKDQLYEVADARPGDCVIFLGATIHRSANLAGAVKPRYGLEARWTKSS